MHASHKQQQEEGVRRSLAKAGIRARYHDISLRDLADKGNKTAERLADWVVSRTVGDGDGLTFQGGNDSEDMAILTARGLQLTGRQCYVTRLLRLSELLSTERAYVVERIEEVNTLVITHAGPEKAGDTVLTLREVRQLEGFLDDWLADGRRLILHSHLPMSSGWFSTSFLQRVASVNTEIGAWQ